MLGRMSEGFQLYIGNLSFKATVDDLRELVEPYGATNVGIAFEPSGYSRGFGFAMLATQPAAQAVIDALDGAPMMGRKLRVQHARPKAAEPSKDKADLRKKRRAANRMRGSGETR